MLKHIMWLQEIFLIRISISSSGWTKKYKNISLTWTTNCWSEDQVKWLDVRLATLEEAEDFQFEPGTFQNKAKKGNIRNQHKELVISTPKKHLHPPNRSSGVPVASIFANLLKGKLFALVRRFQSYQVLIQSVGFNKIFPETKISPWNFWRWLSFPKVGYVSSLEGNFTNRSLGKDVPISREVSKIQFGDVRPVGGACYQ